MTFFEHMVRAVWAMLPTNPVRFWFIWITITAGAAISVAWAVSGEESVPAHQQATKLPINLLPPRRQVGTPQAVATLTLLALLLVSFIAMTLIWEDFAFYDNAILTWFTLRGHDLPLFIFPGDGRFLPLSFQEFNLIRHFTDAIIGYHILPIAQLLIFCWILLILDDELSIVARAALAILALLTPSILLSFSVLLLPERDVVLFLVCLVLSIKRFEQTRSSAWAVAAIVCAQLMIYNKETAFLLVFAFAGSRLILRCRDPAKGPGWDFHRLRDRESRLDLCLAALATLFLLYYFVQMGIHPNMNYAERNRHSRLGNLLSYIKVDLLAFLLMAMVVGRVYLILRHRVAPLPLWDGLAVGAVPYFLSFLYLGIFAPWYLAPVDLIAVLYVGRFAVLSWKALHPWSKIAALILAFTMLLQGISRSGLTVFDLKNSIRAKVEMASVIAARYRSAAGRGIRLFFPFSGPWETDQFACYLNYRGVPAEGDFCKAADPNGVGLAIANNGPGAGWQSLTGHAEGGPRPGDLVIVLPDAEASLAEVSAYRERGEPLFSYEPPPVIPQWLYLAIGNLGSSFVGCYHARGCQSFIIVSRNRNTH
jgi:hypothetical protein